MSKPIIRKHSAKVLSAIDTNGERKFYALIGGLWYYNGNDALSLSAATRTPNGIWRDSIATILSERSSGNTLEELFKYNLKNATDVKVAIHHWTTEQVVPGVPF